MKTTLVFVAFALVVIVFFWDVIVGPKLLIDANPALYDPWRTYASAADLANKTQQTDSFLGYFPTRSYLTESLEAGRFPLWNPYICGGMPYFADPQSRVAYPIALLLAPVKPARAMGYDVAIHIFLAMVGMYLFLRSIRVVTWGAVLGSVSYAFSSFFYVRYGHPSFVASGAWVPFFFYGFELALRRERAGTVLLAGFLAMGYLSGFPQIFLLGVLALVGYALYVGASCPRGQRWREVVKAVRIIAVAGIVSMLVVSAQILMFLEFFRNSIGLHYGFAHVRDVLLAPPAVLMRTMFPSFFGHPVAGTDWSGLTRETVHPYNPEFAVYVGVGALSAALVAAFGLRSSARTRVLLIMLAMSVLVAVEQYTARLGYVLFPMFRASRVSRAGAISCLALSALAAIGFSCVWTGTGREHRRKVIVAVGCLIAVALVSLVVFQIVGESTIRTLAEKVRSLPDDFWTKTQVETRSGALRTWAGGKTAEWLAYERGVLLRGLLATAVACGLLLGSHLLGAARPRVRMALGIGLVLFAGLEVFQVAKSYRISQSPTVFAETEGITALKHLLGPAGEWRVKTFRAAAGDRTAFPVNTNEVFGIPSIYGLNTINTKAFDAYRTAYTGLKRDTSGDDSTVQTLGTGISWLANRLDDLISVRYILAERTQSRYTASSVLRSIGEGNPALARLGMFALGNETRFALQQEPGETFRFEALLLPVDMLCFSVGLDAGDVVGGDSVFFALECRNDRGRVDYRRGLDLARDRGKWHETTLDVSGIKGELATITLSVVGGGARDLASVVGAWSGFEFATGECPVTRADGSYEVKLASPSRCLSLTIRTLARDLPLDISWAEGRTRRWFAFPPGMKSRQVRVDLDGPVCGLLTLSADSTFEIESCRQVPREWGTDMDCALLFDRDMCIYENSRAVPKGICLDRTKVQRGTRGGRTALALASLADVQAAECGRVRITAYEPEEIGLETSAERACYLVFQDMAYPGWSVKVDGREADLVETDIGLRAVELASGDHKVAMKYRPRALRAGQALAFLGLLLAALYLWRPPALVKRASRRK